MGYSKSKHAIDRVRDHLLLLQENSGAGSVYIEVPTKLSPERFLYQIREGIKVSEVYGHKEFAALKDTYVFSIKEKHGKRMVLAEPKSYSYDVNVIKGDDNKEHINQITLNHIRNLLEIIGAALAHKHVERIIIPFADLDEEVDKDLSNLFKWATKHNWRVLYKGGPLTLTRTVTKQERDMEWLPPLELVDDIGIETTDSISFVDNDYNDR